MPTPYQTTCRECGAPRDPHAHTARCTLHEAEYKRQKTQKHRASNPGYSTYHARMMDYSSLRMNWPISAPMPARSQNWTDTTREQRNEY
jgi:hypothetical protein